MKNHIITAILNVKLFLIPLFILTGCSASLYKLNSVDRDKDFYKGKEIVYNEDSRFRTNVSFENQQNNNFIFFVEITNLTDDPVIFYPENIYADQLDMNKNSLSSEKGSRFPAINPGEQIDRLNADLNSRRDQHSLSSGLNLTFALISVAADLSDDNSHHKLKKVSDDITNWSINQTNENADYNNTKNNINSQLEFWENQVLRKTTLYKNNSIGGLIFVPFNKDADFIRLVLPVAGNQYTYLFRKIEVNQ